MKCSTCKVHAGILCRNEFNHDVPNPTEESLKFSAFPGFDDLSPNDWCDHQSRELGNWIGSMRTVGLAATRDNYPLDPQYDHFFDMIFD